MAHFAKLDENNLVIEVVVTDNNDPNGDEGLAWLENNLGGRWVKTSYNTQRGQHILGGIPFRKNYAGIGFYFDEERDAFIPPKVFASWVLNEDTCQWEPPISKPEDAKQSLDDLGKIYVWDESVVNWVEVQGE